MVIHKQDTARVFTFFLLFLIFLVYCFFYSRFFFNDRGLVGGDYSYFLPQLLSGYYWYQHNSFFSIPWFTPAFCGGLPFFPNPQSTYYSTPQLLFNLLGPGKGIHATFLMFAIVGQLSSYYLLKHIFSLGAGSALLGSTLILFNGFYTSRLVMGHLTYHVFMLVPILTACLLYNARSRSRLQTIVITVVTPALIMAYFIYAGAINLIVPILISVIGVYCCYVLLITRDISFWSRFIGCGMLALMLSAAKLIPAYQFIVMFPRDQYSLPGFNGFSAAFVNVARALFDSSNPGIAKNLVNLSFAATDIGFDFSFGMMPLLILLIYLLYWPLNRSSLSRRTEQLTNSVYLLGLMLILLLPVILNTYYPSWNDLFKQLPYIKNSSLLTRWIAIDILPLVILFSFFLDRLKTVRWYSLLVATFILIMLLEKQNSIDRYDSALTYEATNITNAYSSFTDDGVIPAIKSIGALVDKQKSFVMLHGRNDFMVGGVSILNCYEPIFGYQLETFPGKDLLPGAIEMQMDNSLNMNNAACYAFGPENNCTPGTKFKLAQMEQMLAFASYKTYAFIIPRAVKLGVLISIVTMFFCLMLIMVIVLQMIRLRI